MKINNIGYLLKEGIRGIFLHGFMSFAAVCVTVACLLIVGGFSCLMYNVSAIVQSLDKTNQVIALVDETYTDAEARSVGTKINRVENVQNAVPKTREEALEEFVKEHGGSEAFVGVDAETFRHRFVVTLEDNSIIKETVEEIKKVEGVVKVTASYELAEGFTTLQNVLSIASVAVVGVLLVVSLLIISNTVKMAMYDRRDEISIMKMVGATNGFIRLPYVVEGFTLGMLGAGIAFGLLWFLYNLLLERLKVVDTINLLEFVPFQELLLPMIAVFGVAGFAVGVLGGWTSIKKFMDV